MSRRQTPCKLAAQVGARIRFLRLELGWSLRTLGEMARCHPSTLCVIETGQSTIHTQTLRKIARALGVEPFELLNHDTEIDDVAYIVEKMRIDEEVAVLVRAFLEKCGMTGQVN